MQGDVSVERLLPCVLPPGFPVTLPSAVPGLQGAMKSAFTRTGKRDIWGLLDDGAKSLTRCEWQAGRSLVQLAGAWPGFHCVDC